MFRFFKKLAGRVHSADCLTPNEADLIAPVNNNNSSSSSSLSSIHSTSEPQQPIINNEINEQQADGLMYSFDDVLKHERELSQKDAQRFSNLYQDQILELYKIRSTTFKPTYSFHPIYKKLIDAIPDNIIKRLKPFVAYKMNKDERPVISIANHCEYRTMEVLYLNYQNSFIQYILPRLHKRVQYILLTICGRYFDCPPSIDFQILEYNLQLKYKDATKLSQYLLLRLTNNYMPKLIVVSNTSEIEYYKPPELKRGYTSF